MRAVQAAKAQGELSGDDLLNGEAAGAAFDTLLQSALGLLKPILDELHSQEPVKRGLPLAFWLLERAGAPEHLVKELRDLCKQGGGCFPSAAGDKCASREAPLELTPVRPAGSPTGESPKKRQVKHFQSEGGESEIEPKTGSKDPPGKKKVCLWQKDPSDSDDSAEVQDKESDDGKPKRKKNRKKTVLSADPKKGLGTRSSMKHAPGTNPGAPRRERRFTVNITKSVQEMPPVEETLMLLRKVPELQKYSDGDLRRVMNIAQCNKYESEENLINHGCTADELHVIVDGTGKVSIPYQISTFSQGDYFGEEALRLAVASNTVQVSAANGPVTTISVNRKEFQKLHLKQVNIAKAQGGEKKGGRGRDQELMAADAKRTGICGDTGHPVDVSYELTEADRDVMVLALKHNRMLGEVLELSDEQCKLISDSVYVISVPAGQTLMHEGQQGSCLFIVQEGLMEIHVHEKLKGEVKLRSGDSFGEIALLYETPRSATVVACKDTRLWVLTRADYRVVTSLAQRRRIEEYTEIIKKIPCIQAAVEESNLHMIANVLEKVTFEDGEDLCAEGEDEGLLFIIYEGECKVSKDGDDIKTLSEGQWIGEDQLMHMLPAHYTVSPATDSPVTALVLEAGALGAVLKALEEMQRSNNKWGKLRTGLKDLVNGQDQPLSNKEKLTQDFIRKRMSKMAFRNRNSTLATKSEHDVMLTRTAGVLGEGAFGQVLLLEHKILQGTRYALKILSKEHIQEENMGKSVQNERSVMTLLDSDFIVRLYQSYQDVQHIIFMLEPVLGGELFDVFYDNDLYGNIAVCRFCAACVTEGLQHMHTNRVIWRDLKMENCLLDANGYLKLTDMGIAKIVIGKTYTICGTADYFAPETLRQIGHDRGVDWWALGVLLFMMATGRSPFDAPQVTQIYKNIMKGFSKVTFPDTVPSDLIEAVKSLCRKKPEERITMQKGGVVSFMDMPFFSGFDWDLLRTRKMKAPFVPPPTDFEKIKQRRLARQREVDYASIVVWDGSLPEVDGEP